MQDKPDLQLRDVLKAFVVPAAPEVQPARELAVTFAEQLDVAGYLAGMSPLVGLRLTHMKDGSVLGVSLSHVVAGEITRTDANLSHDSCLRLPCPK